MGEPSRSDIPREPIPEPHFFKLGDAARIVGVAPSAVRYWQAEFAAFVRPTRTKSGQHVFSRRDVRALALIRHLIHVDGLSAREARDRLPRLLEAEDDAAEGLSGAEQGILALDLASPPQRIAAPGPDPSELASLREQVTLLERERDALRKRADNADRERDAALAWLSDVSRDRDAARHGLDEGRRCQDDAVNRLDAIRDELRALLADLESSDR